MITFNGNEILTAITKKAVTGPVRVGRENLAGDAQADRRVHGGPDKAVYAFSRDAYAGWPLANDGRAGLFGENLTIDSFAEDRVYLGDRYAIGSVVLQVAQPRVPCFKLNARFGDPTALETFTAHRRPGIYFRVIQEGFIAAGDSVEVLARDENAVSVLDAWDLTMHQRMSEALARRALSIPSLNEKLRRKIERLHPHLSNG